MPLPPALPVRPAPARPPAPARKPAAAPPAAKPAAPDTLVLSPAAVRDAARRVWTEPRPADGAFYCTERDPVDVNERPYGAARDREAAAKAAVAAAMPAERAALDALHDSIKEMRFDQIAARTANDPLARLALQALLVEGRLFAPGPKRDPGDLGHLLAGLATQPLAAGLDGDELVSDLVQELAEPTAIAQQAHGTCTVTALQIVTAIERPATLVRIVAGLASPAGEATLPNGDVVTRCPGTEKPGPRSASTALWAGAMMEYGDGPDQTYDDARDVHLPRGDGGLSARQQAAVANALAGAAGEAIAPVWFYEKGGAEALIDRIGAETAAGRRVPVSLKWGASGPDGKRFDGLHAVIATAVTAGRVTILNPHGAEQSLTRAEFASRLMNAILRPPQ